ncbi:MAG: hypothetical protein IKL41_00020, partial [Clostridia bacterium]|nr:hypothetical protein [Clostridia bacterium]
QIKKHGTLPPKDFKKWAVICEHIIRHYNEGWADGYELDMPYWEIWNEPDLDPDESTNKRTWGGTKAQFFDLYEITATHLKKCFPDLKIGGPGYAGEENLDWMDEFLAEMRKRNVEIDFFSWHSYVSEPCVLIEKANKVKSILLKYGYEKAQSILNEWNYVRGWEEDYLYSIKAIHGVKGAAFTMACISEAQQAPIDMLMYYDTRQSCFNGAFDYYTYEKLPGYYPLYWYGMLYDCQKEIKTESEIENIYSLCGVDESGKATAIITHYSENDDTENKTVSVNFGKEGTYEIYLLDKTHNAELIKTTNRLEFDMEIFSSVMIKEV